MRRRSRLITRRTKTFLVMSMVTILIISLLFVLILIPISLMPWVFTIVISSIQGWRIFLIIVTPVLIPIWRTIVFILVPFGRIIVATIW